jgi:Ca2+-binding RTX toxin-like protein
VRSARLLAAAALTLAALPASAHGGSLSYDGTRYIFTGAPGEANDLRINYGDDNLGPYIEFDDSYVVTDGGGGVDQLCGPGVDGTSARCDFVANPLVNLEDQDDSAQGDISSDGGPEEINGGPGNDRLKGGQGDDRLDGGPGDDELEKGGTEVRGGSDALIGGDGFDATYYRGDFGGAGAEAVTVRLDGAANDGPAGQSDNVQTEHVVGSEQADLLVGGPGPETLDGDAGNDEVRGGSGNDVVDGNLGDDRIFGEDGDDALRDSSATNDLLDGGLGSDDFTADGPCFFIGCNPGGNDEIRARDGVRDTIRCLGGADTAIVDGIDTLLPDRGGCESVDAAGPGPGGGGGFTLSAPSRISFAVLVRRGLVIVVRCTVPCRIDAALLLARRIARRLGLAQARPVVVGRGRRTLSRAGTVRVRVRLTSRAKRRLRRARRVTLTLRVRVRQGGQTSTRTRRVRVRR